MKARVSEHGFALRFVAWNGQIYEDEFLLASSGKLMTRHDR